MNAKLLFTKEEVDEMTFWWRWMYSPVTCVLCGKDTGKWAYQNVLTSLREQDLTCPNEECRFKLKPLNSSKIQDSRDSRNSVSTSSSCEDFVFVDAKKFGVLPSKSEQQVSSKTKLSEPASQIPVSFSIQDFANP